MGYASRVDEVAVAIADPVRRHILTMLRDDRSPPARSPSGSRSAGPPISRHLRVLRESGLVRDELVGRRRIYRLDPGPLAPLLDWLTALTTVRPVGASTSTRWRPRSIAPAESAAAAARRSTEGSTRHDPHTRRTPVSHRHRPRSRPHPNLPRPGGGRLGQPDRAGAHGPLVRPVGGRRRRPDGPSGSRWRTRSSSPGVRYASTRANPQRASPCRWSTSYGTWLLELALTETDGTTELRFVQHLTSVEGIAEVGAGWEYYLDLLVASRDGSPRPQFDDYHPARCSPTTRRWSPRRPPRTPNRRSPGAACRTRRSTPAAESARSDHWGSAAPRAGPAPSRSGCGPSPARGRAKAIRYAVTPRIATHCGRWRSRLHRQPRHAGHQLRRVSSAARAVARLLRLVMPRPWRSSSSCSHGCSCRSVKPAPCRAGQNRLPRRANGYPTAAE